MKLLKILRVIIGNRNPAMNTASSPNSHRLDREKKTILSMIGLYCRLNHKTKTGFCNDCEILAAYASERLARCPFGESKPACSKCEVHCYQPAYRERIRAVMRFSGPRMPLHHPGALISHYVDFLRFPTKAIKK
jgi:hypothetical protein